MQVLNNNINFIFYIFLLAASFIFIGYENESIEKKIKGKEIILENMRYEYITNKTHLMYFTRHSQIKKNIEILGFYDSSEQPIIINNDSE